jgi:hypothetical protein
MNSPVLVFGATHFPPEQKAIAFISACHQAFRHAGRQGALQHGQTVSQGSPNRPF